MPDKISIHEDRKATEYLANERTFLAWIRTSIAVMSLGFVVAKFGVWLRELASHLNLPTKGQETGMSLPIGVTMMAIGAFLAVLAAWHYHAVNKAIEQGAVQPNRGLIITITAAVVVLAALMVLYMLTTSRNL